MLSGMRCDDRVVPATTSAVGQAWLHLRARAGCTDLHFHDLRHEATSRLAAIFELHELAKITGHKDTRMLLRYYHPDGRELARKIFRSPLGRQQLAMIREAREGL